ncbi:hypothetical protein ACF09H_39240 [Streptomyces sp. NPDC014983]|uniref:hypothetical protein n=1 Tax=Streptomyces sp. NPDC014983 TaxID=3364933 RepID=UPI0036F5CBF6
MSTVPPAEGPDESPSDAQWEAFLRDAAAGGAGAPKEPSARARTAAARLRRPRGPRRGRQATAWLARAAPWTAVGAVVVFGAFQMGLIPSSSPSSPAPGPTSGPAKAVSLPGGGFSDGDRCGTKGYHHFPLPPSAESPTSSATDSGPRLTLGSYGYEKLSSRDPGHFTVGLLFNPSRKKLLELSRTLDGQGVAVEIEGPQGLVAGAQGLPVSWPSDVKNGASVEVSGRTGGEITLPSQALCPGYDARSVAEALRPPTDSHNTITGQPRYRLVVSLRDPAVGTLRTSLGLPAEDSLLSANNLVSEAGPWPGGRRPVAVRDV